MFGRATIRLGIGPHSSLFLFPAVVTSLLLRHPSSHSLKFYLLMVKRMTSRIVDFSWKSSLKRVGEQCMFWFFELEISNDLLKVLCGTFATKIYSVLQQGRCGPAITWAEID